MKIPVSVNLRIVNGEFPKVGQQKLLKRRFRKDIYRKNVSTKNSTSIEISRYCMYISV